MSKSRHEHKDGGKVEPEVKDESDVYAGKSSNVLKEAEEKKHGGRAKKAKGGMVHGEMGKKRMDRPGRKRGGRAGAEFSPLTTASKVTDATEHKSSEGNADDGP